MLCWTSYIQSSLGLQRSFTFDGLYYAKVEANGTFQFVDGTRFGPGDAAGGAAFPRQHVLFMRHRRVICRFSPKRQQHPNDRLYAGFNRPHCLAGVFAEGENSVRKRCREARLGALLIEKRATIVSTSERRIVKLPTIFQRITLEKRLRGFAMKPRKSDRVPLRHSPFGQRASFWGCRYEPPARHSFIAPLNFEVSYPKQRS